MPLCPFGKASLVFPLKLSRASVLGALKSTETASEQLLNTEVVGYTTNKTFEAGATSMRVKVHGDGSSIEPGALLVAVRANGREGFLPGLAAPRCGGAGTKSPDIGLEIIVFGRPDKNWEDLMYLPEDVLQALLPLGTGAEVQVLRPLAPVQHDCPPQWLRDRFLRLADGVDTDFANSKPRDSSELQIAIERAGVRTENELDTGGFERQISIPPADTGNRLGQDELGQWDEEMRLTTRCGADVDGGRLDGLDAALGAFPGISSML